MKRYTTIAPAGRVKRSLRRALGGRWLGAALLGSALIAGCDYPFEPFEENEDAPFSIFGALDLYADTQWIRVMPVRTAAFLDRTPIDATVTLQHLASGRTVTLNDSLFSFHDMSLGAVAYAHNFWTTEPLQPGASYRLKAVSSEGDSTTALVTLPGEIGLTLQNNVRILQGSTGSLFVQAEEVVSVEVLYEMQSVCGPGGAIWSQNQRRLPRAGVGHAFHVNGLLLYDDEGCLVDQRRQEVRVTTAPTGWPYNADLSDLDVARAGTATSNVANGIGFVGGLARRTIPYHRCQIVRSRAAATPNCQYSYDEKSATLAGRVMSDPCGEPYALKDIRLTETFPDGGVAIRHWKTGLAGEYRFEGIEPGVALALEVRPIEPDLAYRLEGLDEGTSREMAAASVLQLPRLAAGQRYSVGDILVAEGC